MRHDNGVKAFDILTIERATGEKLPVTTSQSVVTTRLKRVVAKMPPAQRAMTISGRAFTVFLIDQLVPHRDCEAVVLRR